MSKLLTTNYSLQTSNGFTMIEIVVVLAVTAILFLISGSLALNTLPKNTVQVEAGSITDTLRRAQSRTVSGYQDSVWGVHFTATDMTLFAGSSYASRNPALDDARTFSSGITMSGLTDVIFDFANGGTQNIGDIIITSNSTGEVVTLQINSLGRVQKQ